MFPWAALEVKGGKILEPARTITTTLLKKTNQTIDMNTSRGIGNFKVAL